MADIVKKTAELVRMVYVMAEKRTKAIDVEATMKEIETEIIAMDGALSGISLES
jgi:hypothetical protein